MMPCMSGPQLCQKLRASRDEHRTYVIMLTGKSGKEDVVTGLEAGADDYIRKPFDFEELYTGCVLHIVSSARRSNSGCRPAGMT